MDRGHSAKIFQFFPNFARSCKALSHAGAERIRGDVTAKLQRGRVINTAAKPHFSLGPKLSLEGGFLPNLAGLPFSSVPKRAIVTGPVSASAHVSAAGTKFPAALSLGSLPLASVRGLAHQSLASLGASLPS